MSSKSDTNPAKLPYLQKRMPRDSFSLDFSGYLKSSLRYCIFWSPFYLSICLYCYCFCSFLLLCIHFNSSSKFMDIRLVWFTFTLFAVRTVLSAFKVLLSSLTVKKLLVGNVFSMIFSCFIFIWGNDIFCFKVLLPNRFI